MHLPFIRWPNRVFAYDDVVQKVVMMQWLMTCEHQKLKEGRKRLQSRVEVQFKDTEVVGVEEEERGCLI